MSSSIFFKFRNQKDTTPIAFDGSSLSVFEVKREIMKIARLGDGKDFDLEISTSDTNERKSSALQSNSRDTTLTSRSGYDDDTTQIPRSTTVEARRMPASKNGAGRAARYITGSMPLHAKNSHRTESNMRGGAGRATSAANGVGDMSTMTEEEKLNAVMNASNTQFQADLQSSASMPQKRNTFKSNVAVPDKPLPPGYVCYRCRKKGHWIQACPTNNDPTFDGKKPKRTTGIPRSMLEKVEEPDTDKELPQGVFMNQDGDYVRVKTDDATWQKIQEQRKAAEENAKEADVVDQELIDRGLVCALDERPFDAATKTPCCGTTYCSDCIENALIDNDLLCPNCGEQALLDDLKPDEEAIEKLATYNAEKKAAKLQKEKEASKSPKPEAATEETKSPGSTTSPSKKRKADDELESKRRPSNPAEMKRSTSKQGTPVPGAQSATPQPQPPKAPKAMAANNTNADFAAQMNAMAYSMGGVQNGMNAFANPMMNPMMGMGMPPMMPMMPNMMGNFNPMMGMGMGMNGMNGMNGMGYGNGMNGMNNFGNNNMNGNMNQQQPWMNGNGPRIPTGPAAGNGGGGGAYMRQPVNPHRHQNKGRRQRSVDYKQM